jgi:predicted RND superfamily exporter protein
MLAASGGVKLRATSRIGLGLAPLALSEMAVAVALGVLALPGPLLGGAPVRWSVPAAVLLLIGSSIDHAVRLRAYRRRRAESEERRLASFVKHLS